MKNDSLDGKCLLCRSADTSFFFEDKFREFRRCTVCRLIFVPDYHHVSRESEIARYEEHNNDPEDQGYRDFLGRIVAPLIENVPKRAKGLDFGSGPTPLLAALLRDKGFTVEIFDPNYAQDKSVLSKSYDFVITTEVIEHMKRPLMALRRLLGLLKPGGILAIMTLPYNRDVDFSGWHYKNDRTHIAYFSVETFDWLAKEIGYGYKQYDRDIFIFETGNRI